MKHVFTAAVCGALLLGAPAFAQEYPSSTTPDAAIGAGPAPQADCKLVPQPNPDELCPTSGALAIGALPAGGSPGEATGLIASIDVAAGMVQLDDGKTYSMPTNVALNSFSPGQKVKLSFMNQDGHLIASDIKPADTSTPDVGKDAGNGSAY
jgi:hypothetical protein